MQIEEGISVLGVALNILGYIAALAVGIASAIWKLKRNNLLGILTKARGDLYSDIARVQDEVPKKQFVGNVAVARKAISTIKSFMSESEIESIDKQWDIYYKNENNRQACQPGEAKTKKEIIDALEEIITIIDKHLKPFCIKT